MPKSKVTLTCAETFTSKFLDWLEDNYDLSVAGCNFGGDEIVELLEGADVHILGGNETFPAETLDRLPSALKFIFAGIEPSTFFPGTWERVRNRVFATGGGQSAVAKATLDRILVCNPFRLQEKMTRQGVNPPSRDSILKTQKLCVIGAGNIGRMVMEGANGKLKEVVYAGGRGEKPELREKGFKYIKDMREAFDNTDIVTVHLGLSFATQGCILLEHFSPLQQNALFLNNARASIVPIADLRFALTHRTDVQFVFDEFYVNGKDLEVAMKDERWNTYKRIMAQPNFTCTGHTAFRGEETKREYSVKAQEILSNLEK